MIFNCFDRLDHPDGKNELKSTIHFSKLYRGCRARALSKLATAIRFSSK